MHCGADPIAATASGGTTITWSRWRWRWRGSAPARAPVEITEDERAQIRALQREWGVAGAGIYDSDGRRLDDVAYYEDLGMAMDDPNYPRW